jgi:hypothetical protein
VLEADYCTQFFLEALDSCDTQSKTKSGGTVKDGYTTYVLQPQDSKGAKTELDFAAWIIYLHSMSEDLLCTPFGEMFVPLLPLLRESDAKIMREYLPNSFQRHSFDFGEAEDNEGPAGEADAAVKSESAAWR